jgi:hypothetical protein
MEEEMIRRTLTFKKTTKHTTVYEDTSDDAPVSTLYVLTSELPDPRPESITVTVEV